MPTGASRSTLPSFRAQHLGRPSLGQGAPAMNELEQRLLSCFQAHGRSPFRGLLRIAHRLLPHEILPTRLYPPHHLSLDTQRHDHGRSGRRNHPRSGENRAGRHNPSRHRTLLSEEQARSCGDKWPDFPAPPAGWHSRIPANRRNAIFLLHWIRRAGKDRKIKRVADCLECSCIAGYKSLAADFFGMPARRAARGVRLAPKLRLSHRSRYLYSQRA